MKSFTFKEITISFCPINNLLVQTIMLYLFSVSVSIASPAINGIIFNQTKTPLARIFFEAFASRWHELSLSKKINLSIKESYIPRSGNQIVIFFRGQTVFQATIDHSMSVSDEFIENAIQLTAKAVLGHLQPPISYDLARDELEL